MSRTKICLIGLFLLPCLTAQTWRELGDERGIRIGAAADPSRFSEDTYAGTLSREFNLIEPENAMKFGPIHTGPDTYNFGPADAVVDFGVAHKMAARGHVLVWHSQNPAWLTGGGYTAAQQSAILQSHIKTVVGRYAGRVYAWDVVNEAFNDDGTMRSTLWSDAPGIGLPGYGYIEQAFRWAHEADPNALLFYNDYSNEGLNAKSDAAYAMAKDFVARGVPIHGIGLQMHFTQGNTALSGVESNIRRITDLGLQVQITEFDVRLPVDASGAATAAALAVQAQIYRDVAALCLKFPLCTAIQTWGFTDRYSWVPATFPGFGAALPFDAAYQPKEAYTKFRDALASSPAVISSAGLVSAASYAGGGVAPGEIVTLYGATFGPSDLRTAQLEGTKVASNLAGVRLLFDGVPAPLLYARVGQMSAVAPFSLEGKTSTTMQYEYQGVRSNTVSVPVVAARPAIFTLDSSGRGPAAVLDANYRVIGESNRARKGGVVLVYATGGGGMTGAVTDGETAAAAPYATLKGQVTAKIGGVDCRVLYAGVAPGFIAGALQLNVEIAAGVPSGVQPITLTVGITASQAGVTILVE